MARVVITFDLANVPENASITNAVLSFYVFGHGTQMGTGGAPNNSAKSLYQITKAWNAKSVSWNNQPTFNNAAVAQNSNTGTAKWEDYTVTTPIKDIIEKKVANNGFLLKFPTEDQYRGARIHSSEAQNTSLRPKLLITYTVPTEITATKKLCEKKVSVAVQSKNLVFHISDQNRYTLTIFDLKGVQVASFKTEAGSEWFTVPAAFSSGIHIVLCHDESGIITQKIPLNW
ncbi:MAG: DNRLRE domain-containing protein [Chitinivibrionales bacterium]|nr:DNRLRE domain-containing protein [Chitinivibrionales bacterium]